MNDSCNFLPFSLTHVRELNVLLHRDSAFGVAIRTALIARAYINNGSAVIFQPEPSSGSAESERRKCILTILDEFMSRPRSRSGRRAITQFACLRAAVARLLVPSKRRECRIAGSSSESISLSLSLSLSLSPHRRSAYSRSICPALARARVLVR